MTASFKNPGKAVKSPSKLAHVVLRTNNYDAMRSFYKTFLGAHATLETDILCFMGYDEEHHRIGIINMPDLTAKKPGSSGLEHIAFTFNNINDLALTYLQRKENGILPFWQVNHGPTMSVYYKDPDGNVLETFTDNFEKVEDMMAWMESREYQTNPIGVDFDMEEVIKQLEACVSFDDIRKRPDIGPRGIDTVPQ
jgi:catechol-2,3-dioxygenase